MEDPTVPLYKVMPATAQDVLILLMGVLALASLAYSLRESRRRSDFVPLLVFLGAGLAVWYEPLGDAMVHVYYSERGQETWIHAFGRDIPVFIGLLYFWYVPLGAYILLRRSERGITARQWWTSLGAWVAFAAGFEMVVLAVCGTTWTYHGEQFLKVFDVPLWAPVTYFSFEMGIGLGVCALARWLPRRWHWLIVPAMPALMAATHVGVSLPVAIALFANSSQALTAVGAALSVGLVVALAALCQRVFERPWPSTASGTVRRSGAEPAIDGGAVARTAAGAA